MKKCLVLSFVQNYKVLDNKLFKNNNLQYNKVMLIIKMKIACDYRVMVVKIYKATKKGTMIKFATAGKQFEQEFEKYLEKLIADVEDYKNITLD